MAATDPTSLLAAAACYECGGDAGSQRLMILALLRQIVLNGNPVAAVDAQTLLNQAACYTCLTPGMWQLLELALLAQIAQSGTGGGGGGGGAAILGTFATPNGNVTGSKGQFYVDTNLQTLWVQENAAGGNTGWVQFV